MLIPKQFSIGESDPFGVSFDSAWGVDRGEKSSCFHVETRSDSIGFHMETWLERLFSFKELTHENRVRNEK